MQAAGPTGVIEWLLDSDPAVRWQVLRDLTAASPAEVTAERSRVASEGWGARLLGFRDQDGMWAGGACFPGDFHGDLSRGQPWTSTYPVLLLLRELGVDPADGEVQRAITLVRDNCRWEHAGQPFFDGEVEPCINGGTLAIGSYFGVKVDRIADRLISEQLPDGGWNCEAEHGSVRSSFHTTICVLEGLLAYQQQAGTSPALASARQSGEEYLLQRRLHRRLSTAAIVDAEWLSFSFPPRWHYDVLRGLDYFRSASKVPDPRVNEAVELVRRKRPSDGRWLLENTHPGTVHFGLEEGDGRPSRWNTLRALRALAWHDGALGPS